MKLFKHSIPFYAAAVVLVALVALGAGNLIEDLRMPLGFYEDGKPRMELRAKRATMPDAGPIKADEVTITLLNQDGTVEARVEAVDAECDRAAKTAQSESDVKMTRGDMELTGRGFTVDAEKKTLHIKHNARLSFRHPVMELGKALKEGRKDDAN
jgi:hypothetical protein